MVHKIDRSELLELIAAGGAQLVDVLPPAEYEESHLPGAVSIPLKQLTAATTQILRTEDPVVVYCHDGL